MAVIRKFGKSKDVRRWNIAKKDTQKKRPNFETIIRNKDKFYRKNESKKRVVSIKLPRNIKGSQMGANEITANYP